jgi:hypothetical protein
MRAVRFDVARPAGSYSEALSLLGLDAAAIPELHHA